MHVDFIDQTLRDGQQSLWGLRMRAFEALPALPHLDRTGFRTLDLTGAGMFTVLLRTFKDDPWETTDLLIAGLPNTKLRAATRTISVGGMGFRAIAEPFVVGYVDVGWGGEGPAVLSGINYPF